MSPLRAKLAAWLRASPRAYGSLALIAFNTVVALTLANWATGRLFDLKRSLFPSPGYLPELSGKFTADGAPVPNGKRSVYLVELFDRHAFGDSATDREIGEMLDEFHDLGVLPQEYLGSGLLNPPAFPGKHIRLLTDEAGVRFRWTPSADREEKDALRVFVFGGSTTFGLHAADGHTWPAYLEGFLSKAAGGRRVLVRNYGRSGYDASNELLLFLLLLQRGQRPDVAIFLDGVNEHRSLEDGQFGNRELARLVEKAYRPPTPKLTDLPAIRNSGFFQLATSLGRMGWGNAGSRERLVEAAEVADPEKAGDEMAENYLRTTGNTEAVARANGVRAFFFLQPDATYNYPRHLFRKYPPFVTEAIRESKARFYERLRAQPRGIHLTDLFEKWGDRKAVVDDCHYSPAFAEFLARAVSARVAGALRPAGGRELTKENR